jgi:hypothetical protein
MRYATSILATLSLSLQAAQAVPPRRAAETIVGKYVNAVGGDAAISAVASRVTRGTFDNGRGLVTPFITWTKTPGKLATQIGRKDITDGEGSGRATDGRIGWDKNFVGTGLRDMTADELVEVKRTADPFRPAHLIATCSTVDVEEGRDVSGVASQLVRCDLPDGVERWTFSSATGLVDRLDATSRTGRTTTIYFDDYRRADGLLTPFRERIVVPGANVTYTAATIRYNEAVPESVFAKPPR